MHDHYKPVIHRENKHPCDRCRTPLTVPLTIEAAPEAERKRIYYQSLLRYIGCNAETSLLASVAGDAAAPNQR